MGASFTGVGVWLPQPLPHVPYPQPMAGFQTRDIPYMALPVRVFRRLQPVYRIKCELVSKK